MNSFEEVTQWLFSQLPVFQQQGASAYKPGLDKMLAFAEMLGQPHSSFPSIHIAGTNGKGSTSHMIASVLQEKGYSVGLYTSPHLVRFSERIRINGVEVEDQFVIDFVRQHQHYFLTEQLSFFEITVGMAFAYFAEKEVDYAVIEVGLGGRLDATNIVNPLLSVITNIGLDHTEFLGTSLAEIAAEKGGIIKTGIPVVIGKNQAETKAIFEELAKQQRTTLCFAEEVNVPSISLDLLGHYQEENKRTAFAALRQLLGDQLDERALVGFSKVVQNTGLRGRWEIMGNAPLIIADVTHNKDGFVQVIPQLESLEKAKLHIVLGFVQGKAIDEIFALLPKNATYYLSAPAISRAIPVNKIEPLIEAYGLNAMTYTTVIEAVNAATVAAQEEDVIYVGGSTFVVAEILSERAL
ncbi:bifunctional folylpolyglutamate synthase/dihydrofolate synthase [Flavobacteriaceae bacterium]|nr:bifunctional folylpolyglutamate synthase/dihydrofolate synthase [Flavobacteriaceae bacterium]MDA9184219.1 bifunctional folylpolyglutamate synthase/dihydrofolate synthase [Flavobacteriaceae bacterium]MDA9294709.1 bifunctional folylpolyglutamate synthase/dihydrofolate synthase [Flavobacteriaceae bacterium]MDA9972037.1 bifunctional folylpolyglutamate synthase/dihydrofolate synthase [Flavobacteriaceae bacterium]MDB4187321.1 bifunctional folylpolyglutamate synthase/dihydrofolate synthase [Flavoba